VCSKIKRASLSFSSKLAVDVGKTEHESNLGVVVYLADQSGDYYKTFTAVIYECNKLECLFLAGLSSLV
jgi:hypothetical protein